MFGLAGTGQNMFGLNWGNGFITDRDIIDSRGLSNPNKFFQRLVMKPYVKKVRGLQEFAGAAAAAAAAAAGLVVVVVESTLPERSVCVLHAGVASRVLLDMPTSCAINQSGSISMYPLLLLLLAFRPSSPPTCTLPQSPSQRGWERPCGSRATPPSATCSPPGTVCPTAGV
jgi:hypothetical protein